MTTWIRLFWTTYLREKGLVQDGGLGWWVACPQQVLRFWSTKIPKDGSRHPNC